MLGQTDQAQIDEVVRSMGHTAHIGTMVLPVVDARAKIRDRTAVNVDEITDRRHAGIHCIQNAVVVVVSVANVASAIAVVVGLITVGIERTIIGIVQCAVIVVIIVTNIADIVGLPEVSFVDTLAPYALVRLVVSPPELKISVD